MRVGGGFVICSGAIYSLPGAYVFFTNPPLLGPLAPLPLPLPPPPFPGKPHSSRKQPTSQVPLPVDIPPTNVQWQAIDRMAREIGPQLHQRMPDPVAAVTAL